MALWRRVLLVGVVASAGCGDSGQTGSVVCANPNACACQFLVGQMLVQAEVTEVYPNARWLTLEVLQVLNPNAGFNEEDVHRRFQGQVTVFDPGQARDNMYCGDAPLPVTGDLVLASFSANGYRYAYCPKYGTGAESCVPDRSETLFYIDAKVLPWQEPITLADLQFSPEQAASLSDENACSELFPPAPACGGLNDQGCNFGRQPPSSALAWTSLLGLFVLAARKRGHARDFLQRHSSLK